jgi:hypothetical protein
MRFDWQPPTDRLTAEDQRRWSEVFADVTFACSECDSEETTETDQRVPAGTHHMVRCPAGHVTVGIPPARFRRPQTDEGRPQP